MTLTVRQEMWRDHQGTISIQTNWLGKPGDDIENLVSVTTKTFWGVNYAPVSLNQTLYTQQAKAFYQALIDHADRVG